MGTKEEDFKERFVALMRDLRENATKDPEATWLIGSLAGRLIDLYKLKTWGQFKAALTPPAFNKLLKDFENEGNAFHRQGKTKAAYAVQVLAVSLIARTQTDEQVKAGDSLLDEMIQAMVVVYRGASARKKRPA
ncbi:MAG: hypothetical protein IPK28_22480 [Devosia sp.]|nr:hypothetical protein [Devosia sp.]